MQGQADSTTVTYSKLPNYLQLSNDQSVHGLNDSVAVGYAATTIRIPQLRSSHQQVQQTSSSPGEPNLSDCGITPSPSDSTSSGDDTNRDTLFRPIDFDGVSVGMCRSVVPLTPPESSNGSRSGSSDRGSSNEDDFPDVLLVRIPRRPSMIMVNDHRSMASNEPCSYEPNLKPVNGSENDDPELTCSGSQASQPVTHHARININLLDKDLWKMFESVGNEMIVTKPGR